MTRVDAWVKGADRCDPTNMLINPTVPNYILERVQFLAADQVIYSLIDAEAGAPVSQPGWQRTDWFKKPDSFRFILAGSPHPWKLISSTFNQTAKRLEVILAVDHDYSKLRPENPLFRRLMDELSAESLRLLGTLDVAFTPKERQTSDRDLIMAARCRVESGRVAGLLEELADSRLVHPERFNGPDPSAPSEVLPSLDAPGGMQFETFATARSKSFAYLLTSRGRDLVAYQRRIATS